MGQVFTNRFDSRDQAREFLDPDAALHHAHDRHALGILAQPGGGAASRLICGAAQGQVASCAATAAYEPVKLKQWSQR